MRDNRPASIASRPTVARLATALCLVAVASTAAAECSDMPGPGVDWVDCSKERLMLGDSDLSGANLESTLLSGTGFAGATLVGANLQRSELVRTSFKGADLSRANLEKALASRANFGGAILRDARLVKAEFLRVDFTGADLSGADLSAGDFHRNDFTDASLAGADLHDAILPRAVFAGADLTGVRLDGAFLGFEAEVMGGGKQGLAHDAGQDGLIAGRGDEPAALQHESQHD